ncbi:MAG: orotate phosphoribosyltransferase [Thaumarchaeota archaeon]|nr:orotate phosphoribosyltransferase [Nitrososphaerota archaeon]MCL5317285.1 orotate phosphoribosyltransferase [Nitrososphaerota archaeon]
MKWKEEREQVVRDLGRILVQTRAIQFGTFTLSSGKMSSYYVDLRIVPSYPDVFEKAVTAYIDAVKNLIGLEKVDAVAGVPTSGLTYATAVAYNLRKPLIYVRDEVKEYGTAKKIEGVMKPGAKVVILDDLITTGNSLIKTIDAIRSEGGEVDNAVVLIDRLEGGRERLAEKKVKLNPVTDMLELTNLLYDMDLINEDENAAVKSQIQQGAARTPTGKGRFSSRSDRWSDS